MSNNKHTDNHTGLVLSILHSEFDLDLPRRLARDFVTELLAMDVKSPADVTPSELVDLFLAIYARDNRPLRYLSSRVASSSPLSTVVVRLVLEERPLVIDAAGTGPLDALITGLHSTLGVDMHLRHFSQHGLSSGNTAAVAAYVCVQHRDLLGLPYEIWGVGTDRSTLDASFKAVVASLNRSHWRPVSVPF